MKTVPLSHLVEVNPAPPEHMLSLDDEVSFIPMADVDEQGRWVNRQTRKLREVRSGYTAFAECDVLVAKITPCLENGKGAHAVGLENGIGYGTTEFHVLRAFPHADARFIFQITQDKLFRLRATAQMIGSAGQQRVPARFFSEYQVPDYDPAEQAEVARILAQVDEAIDLTRSLLAKRQRLHNGLSDALLTRGVDKQGQLRQQETHVFKETSVGYFPVEWDTVPLGQLLSEIEYGLSVAMQEHGSIPILRMNNQKDGEIDTSDLKYVSASTARPRLLKAGDVLLNRTNSIEHVGRTAIWRGQLPACTFASYLLRLIPEPDKLDSEFLNAALNRAHVQARLKQIVTRAVQQANINPTNLRAFQLPLPRDLNEQRHIVSILSISQAALEALQRELEKLSSLKVGLMQSLLTGRVRVIPQPISL